MLSRYLCTRVGAAYSTQSAGTLLGGVVVAVVVAWSRAKGKMVERTLFFLPHLEPGFLTRRSFDRLPFVSELSAD